MFRTSILFTIFISIIGLAFKPPFVPHADAASTYASANPKKLNFNFPAPESDSWEAWIGKIHNLKSGDKSPPRPDKRSLFMPLPLWVDCHLSWLFERKSSLPLKIKLPEELVLESSPSSCADQSERWAIKKF